MEISRHIELNSMFQGARDRASFGPHKWHASGFASRLWNSAILRPTWPIAGDHKTHTVMSGCKPSHVDAHVCVCVCVMSQDEHGDVLHSFLSERKNQIYHSTGLVQYVDNIGRCIFGTLLAPQAAEIRNFFPTLNQVVSIQYWNKWCFLAFVLSLAGTSQCFCHLIALFPSMFLPPETFVPRGSFM